MKRLHRAAHPVPTVDEVDVVKLHGSVTFAPPTGARGVAHPIKAVRAAVREKLRQKLPIERRARSPQCKVTIENLEWEAAQRKVRPLRQLQVQRLLACHIEVASQLRERGHHDGARHKWRP
eukprot:scaffold104115_cov67-Phaeocystis_antarctica.AAC.5